MSKTEKAYFPTLDGLRAIAILLVLLRHLYLVPEVSTIFSKITWRLHYFGWLGVDLFFVLSVFLISSILLKDRLNNFTKYLKNFYIKRILRIWPPYILFLVFLIFLVPHIVDQNRWSTEIQYIWDNQEWLWVHAANVLIILKEQGLPFNSTILWSLAVEEQFYFFWPFVIFLFGKSKFFGSSLIALIGLQLIIRFLLINTSIDLNVFTPTRLDGFVIGTLIAYYNHKIEISSKMLLKIGLISISILGAIWVQQGFIFYQGYWVQTLGYPVIAILFGTILWWALKLDEHDLNPAIAKLLRHPFLALLSKYSYVLYLVHHPIAWFLKNTFKVDTFLNQLPINYILQFVLWFTLNSLVSLAVSILVYHAYEKHFLKLKGRIVPKKNVVP